MDSAEPDGPASGRWLVVLFALTVLAGVLAAATGWLAAWRVTGVFLAATVTVAVAHWQQVTRR